MRFPTNPSAPQAERVGSLDSSRKVGADDRILVRAFGSLSAGGVDDRAIMQPNLHALGAESAQSRGCCPPLFSIQ